MIINYELIKHALANFRKWGGDYTQIDSIDVIGEKVIINKKKEIKNVDKI